MPSLPRFRVRSEQTQRELRETLRLWGVGPRDYSLRIERARPGSPRGGVEVEFVKGGLTVRVASDRYDDVADNLRACYLAIHHARLDDKRGVRRWQEALAPYLQLGPGNRGAPNGHLPPPPASPAADDPWAVLGLMRGHADVGVVRAVYQARMKAAHPDAGGTHEAAARINEAYRRVMAELGELGYVGHGKVRAAGRN